MLTIAANELVITDRAFFDITPHMMNSAVFYATIMAPSIFFTKMVSLSSILNSIDLHFWH
jgi:hypothetical protein